MRVAATLFALLLAGCLPANAESAAARLREADGWKRLASARNELRDTSPLAARFTQTFVPSGFSTGDSETGDLYVDLPLCMRFAYQEPFPKEFLLCGDWVYTWNPGEPSGRRYLIETGDAEGLALLRLQTEELQKQFHAEVMEEGEDRVVVELTSLDDSEIRRATLELATTSAAGLRLVAVAYEDASGNRTRFDIDTYRTLEPRSLDGHSPFDPPDLRWLED